MCIELMYTRSLVYDYVSYFFMVLVYTVYYNTHYSLGRLTD